MLLRPANQRQFVGTKPFNIKIRSQKKNSKKGFERADLFLMASFHLQNHMVHTLKFSYLPSMKKKITERTCNNMLKKKRKTGNSSYQTLNGIIILLDVNNSAVNGRISRILTLILCLDFTVFPSYNSICKELLSSCLCIVLDFKL